MFSLNSILPLHQPVVQNDATPVTALPFFLVYIPLHLLFLPTSTLNRKALCLFRKILTTKFHQATQTADIRKVDEVNSYTNIAIFENVPNTSKLWFPLNEILHIY